MSQFNKYIGSNDPIISNAAENMSIATVDYQAGIITKAEYDELCGDICDSSTIASQVSDIIRIQTIYDAFNTLLKIASLL